MRHVDFSGWLKKRLKYGRFELSSVAAVANISRTYLYHLRTGRNQHPSREVVHALCAALRVPVDEGLAAAGLSVEAEALVGRNWEWHLNLGDTRLAATFLYNGDVGRVTLSASPAPAGGHYSVRWVVDGRDNGLFEFKNDSMQLQLADGDNQFHWLLGRPAEELSLAVAHGPSSSRPQAKRRRERPTVEWGVFPVTLFGRPQFADASERSWTLLHTKPRMELRLAAELHRKNIAYFMPMVQRHRRLGGKIALRRQPLWGGYLFSFSTSAEESAIRATKRVARVIYVPPESQTELAHDLANLFALIQSGLPLVVETKLEPGTRVRVKSGPLAGHEGTVLRRRGETRLLVAVRFLQQGASVQIDEADLEPLS